MKEAKGWIVAILLLWLAAGCQQAISYRISFAGSAPDFLLIVVSTSCLFFNRRNGAAIGFLGGLISGALAGGHLAAYTVTRTVLGFFVGWLTGLEFEGNIAVAFVVTAVATLFTQFAFLLLAPRGAILPFLLATIGSAMYNGVLAIPFYVLLKKVLDSPRR